MKLLSSMLLATALVTCSGLAVAQPGHDGRGWYDQDHGHGHGRGHDRGDDRGYDRDRGDRDGYYSRDDDDRWEHGHGHGRGHDRDWVPPGHRWERGHRYTGPVYVVRDYRSYRLRPPPRGYHWVRDDDGQYLLVAITTGIILDMVLH